MTIPNFTAGNTLSASSGHYRTSRRPANAARRVGELFTAAEVINIHGYPVCEEGEIQLGEGASTTCINPITFWGELAPIPGGPPGGGTGGGGGAGGGGVPSGGGTMLMDTFCVNANKGCPINSLSHTCAILKCQEEYCNTNLCTGDEKQKGRDAAELQEHAMCELAPRCKKQE
jgi:hypothetical protein